MSSLPNLDSKIITQTMSQVVSNKEVLKLSESDDNNLIILSSLNSLNYQGSSNSAGGGACDSRRIPAKKRQIMYDEISNFERQCVQNINIPNAKTDDNGGGQENDDNFHFLMSLLPYLREVPKNRKMAIRLKLQKVFVEEQERKSVCKNNWNGANSAKNPNDVNFNNNNRSSPFSASCAILLQNLQQQQHNLQQQQQQQQTLHSLQRQQQQQQNLHQQHQNLQNLQQQQHQQQPTTRPPPPPYHAHRNDVNKFAPTVSTVPLQNATAATYTAAAFGDLMAAQQPNLPQYSAAVNGLQTGQQCYNAATAADPNNGGLGFSTTLMDNNGNISYQSVETGIPQTFTYLQ